MKNMASGRQRFVALVCFLLLMVCVLVAYRETFAAMVGIWWRSETFTHAFLVPPIVAWIVWREREELKYIPFNPNAWILLPLLGMGLFWLLGDLVAVNAVTQFAVVAMLVLLVPLVFGLAVARHLIFPLAFLFFCVPVGEFAMPLLMEWTADFTVLALRATGIPVYREGLQFVIPTGNWSVVEACSGVRYLIASLTVGTLFAYLNYKSIHRRLIFIVVSALVPILANWLRAYMIVMLGHVSGNKLAAGVDHLIYGWVFFGIVILLMFMIGAKWADMPLENASVATGFAMNENTPNQTLQNANQSILILMLLGAMTVSMPMVARLKIDKLKSMQPVQLLAPQVLGNGWQRSDAKVAEWAPAFENPSAEINTTYQNGGEQVGLYIGYYRNQNYQRKLVSSQNVLVRSKDANWAQVSSGTVGLEFLGQRQMVRSAQLRASSLGEAGSSPGLSVRQVYWINGKLTASDLNAKLQGALMQLLAKGDDSAVVILYAKVEPGRQENAVFESFVRANGALILKMLDTVAAQGSMSAPAAQN